jgi:hypothetical protein
VLVGETPPDIKVDRLSATDYPSRLVVDPLGVVVSTEIGVGDGEIDRGFRVAGIRLNGFLKPLRRGFDLSLKRGDQSQPVVDIRVAAAAGFGQRQEEIFRLRIAPGVEES